MLPQPFQNYDQYNLQQPFQNYRSSNSPYDSSEMFGGISSLASGIYNLFGSKNPSDSAQKYLNQIPQTLQKYSQPYINAGNEALPQLQQQYSSLLGDPSAFLQNLASSYQASPGYEWQLNQALQGANQAAAAGGLSGTPQSQQIGSDIAQQMANKDFYNYLSELMGVYRTGLQGQQ